jgi:hypothetical protein
MASATAGLRWVAITGFAHGQPLNVKWANSSTPAMVLGNTNAFSEVNNQNLNAGSSASSDFVLTADNGSASTHYVDLGINGSTGGAAPFTTVNGAYLYTTDNQLDISAQGASGLINLSVGATPTILAAFDVTNGITFNDKTTPSKQLRLQLANQTASTILTLNTGAQTASRQLSVPVLAANDTVAVIGQAQTFAGIQTLSDTTDATSTTAAALVVSGGVGIAKQIRAGGAITCTGVLAGVTVSSIVIDTGDNKRVLAVGPTAGTHGILNLVTATSDASGYTSGMTINNGIVTIPSTTDATSTTAAALVVSGGVGIAKKLYVGGFAQFSSDVTIDKTGGALQFNVKSDDAQQAEFKFANRSGQGLSIFRPGGSTNLEFYAQASSSVLTLTNSALASGQASVLYTTDATTATAGAFAVSGGIAVAKRLCLDGATGKTIKYVNGTANAAVAVTFGAVGPTGSTAGNQQGWVRVDIGGTDRYIPYW